MSAKGGILVLAETELLTHWPHEVIRILDVVLIRPIEKLIDGIRVQSICVYWSSTIAGQQIQHIDGHQQDQK